MDFHSYSARWINCSRVFGCGGLKTDSSNQVQVCSIRFRPGEFSDPSFQTFISFSSICPMVVRAAVWHVAPSELSTAISQGKLSAIYYLRVKGELRHHSDVHLQFHHEEWFKIRLPYWLMPPATMIFIRNFRRIIGLIIERLLVRIRLFWRDDNEVLTNFLSVYPSQPVISAIGEPPCPAAWRTWNFDRMISLGFLVVICEEPNSLIIDLGTSATLLVGCANSNILQKLALNEFTGMQTVDDWL